VGANDLDLLLPVCEIFASIQGESTHAGELCTFVRTVGCNLRCNYCDTAYAYSGGTAMRLRDVLAEVARLELPLVELTGGEPLLEPAAPALMRLLCDRGYRVLCETNGSLDISLCDPRVVRIMDLKTPSSGEAARNDLANLARLRLQDELKLVIGERADYEWAKALLAEHALAGRCTLLLAPMFGRLAPRELAQWILDDKLAVRLQVQLHKLIWDPAARGV